MSESHHHHDHSHGHHGHPPRKGLHKDWRVWTAVILMLAGIVAYILSLNESIQPGGKTAPQMPAAQ